MIFVRIADCIPANIAGAFAIFGNICPIFAFIATEKDESAAMTERRPLNSVVVAEVLAAGCETGNSRRLRHSAER